jgi:hypothetical protein
MATQENKMSHAAARVGFLSEKNKSPVQCRGTVCVSIAGGCKQVRADCSVLCTNWS